MWDTVLRSGIHEHRFTCKKPPPGKIRCRMAKPSGDSSATLPVMLEIPEELVHLRSGNRPNPVEGHALAWNRGKKDDNPLNNTVIHVQLT